MWTRIFSILYLFLAFPSLAVEVDGNLDIWSLYITDDFDTQSVVEIYEGASCDNPGDVDFVVYGRDRPEVSLCDTRCCLERIIRNGETIVERRISDPEGGDQTISTRSFETGDTFLSNIGLNTDVKEGKYSAKVNGDFTTSLLSERTLYGHKQYRFRFTDFYARYTETTSPLKYRATLGRQAVTGGVIVDGLSADYLFGGVGSEENKSVGAFVGLAPDPITKHPSKDFMSFGARFQFIPEFSSKTLSKFKLNASIVAETYKGDMSRLYFFSSSHFSPTDKLAFFHYSTVELPSPSGEDKDLQSSHFSLQSIYRPARQWFLSAGFSQFRIDRFLVDEAVRWLTDSQSYQSDRIGDTLDRSDRYRIDFRVAYQPLPLLQPYIRLRYERRDFDSSKSFLNNNPSNNNPPEDNLNLLNNKNAYKGSFGLNLFPLPKLSTQSEFTYNKRFQSTAYDFFQSAEWQEAKWSTDVYAQVVWSSRSIQNSVPNVASINVDATDYYAGCGASYKILSDLLGQIRYDFAIEDDYSLGGDIQSHSILGRIDYRF